jgi:16S rRNA (cytosine1402-N4)-methyltransferase
VETLSAFEVVNNYSRAELERIIFAYGEERFARSIASGIVKAREKSAVETTNELAEIIRNAVPLRVRREKNPCRKTFQAIRIEVNRELDSLKKGLDGAFSLLKPGGRLAVITFHSLEDRIVKNFFSDMAKGCVCPPEFPVCICGNKPKGTLVHRKVITPGEDEMHHNKRSRSAKLRILEKI